MGLLDNLESMAMGKVAGGNPEVAAVLQLIQNHPGGISGLLQSFHSNGLGGLVNSWISTGENQAVSPAQMQQVLGSVKCRPSRQSWAFHRSRQVRLCLNCFPR